MEQDELKRTPIPILYIYKGKIEQPLANNDFNTAINIKTEENINEVRKLTFTIPFNSDRKLNYGDNEKRVYYDGIVYIIKDMEFDNTSSNQDINVTCLEYCEVLKNAKCENLDEIAKTPEEIFNAIVTASKLDIGYKWGGTDLDSNVLRHLITTSETSIYENLIKMAENFDSSLEFYYSEDGQGYVYLRSKPIQTGKFYRDGIDLKDLKVTYNSEEIYSKIYATGYTDDDGITLDIQSVNNGSSLLEDKSYFKALGIPDTLLETDPQYNGIYEYNNTDYTDASDLLIKAKEELAKVCVPKITADVTISDLSQIVGSPVEPPVIGEEVKLINKEIDFIFTTYITGIERDYSNPLETKLTISNDVPYRTLTQTYSNTSDIVSSVTSTTTTTNSDGTTSSSSTVIASKVVDGDHVNVVMRNAETKSLITQTASEISLRVDDINTSYAELKVTSDSITSHVEDISDTSQKTYSEIQQTATKIKAVVVEGDESGSWELSKDAFTVAFSKASADVTTIDENGITAKNSDGSYTRMGSKGLEHIDGSTSKPYHYLSYTTVYRGLRGYSDSYREYNYPLPSMFSNIANPDENISISASIAKIYDSNDGSECLQYWSGAYASIVDGQIQLNVLSTWRDYSYNSNSTDKWVEEFSNVREGYIDVQVTLIA